MMNVILICVLLWILPFYTGMMWWQERKSNGLVMGINSSKEFQDDAEIKKIQNCFKKELIGITIGLFPIPFIGFLIPYDSIVLTMDMLWLGLVFLLPFLAFYKGHKRVKEKKQREGYAKGKSAIRLVDTKAADLSRKVSHISFAVATVISFLPFLLAAVAELETEIKLVVMIVLGALAVTTPLFWIGSVLSVHTRSEVISGNSTVNENFLRTKCRIWDICMQRCAWINAVFVILVYALRVWGTKGHFLSNQVRCIVVLCIVYCAVLIVLLLKSAGKINRIRLKLSGQEAKEVQAEEDDYWLCGMFYYNPNDTHFMVEKRVGVGTTVNFATKGGKLFGIFTAASLLIIPIICIWMIFEEFTPISLAITSENTVVASHLTKEYEVACSDIEEVKLVDQLSGHGKIWGTNMQSLEKGTFESDEYGTYRACLNPKKGPYLYIRTEDKTYIFSDSDERNTREIFLELKKGNEK